MEEQKLYEELSPEDLSAMETQAAYGVDMEEEEAGISDPFNPDHISINSKVIAMEACLRRMHQGTIILNPDFQRQEVWTKEKRSQLIESLMLKIPLPMFYVSSDEQGNYTVVDGLQRLSTIRDFVLGQEYLHSRDATKRGEGFVLQDLEFWTIYNGKTFAQLPTHLQNRILETEFSFTIINPGTPEEVKRNIFKRINTGGEPLSSQEIRNALYHGAATDLLKRLVHLPEFLTATGESVPSKRMEDQELVLRFLAFLIRDHRTYRRTLTIDRFLSETMIILNAHAKAYRTRDYEKLVEQGHIQPADINQAHIERAEDLFRQGMSRAYSLFAHHCFRKSYQGRRSPINKGLFEMWGVLLALMPENAYQCLKHNRQSMFEAYYPLLDDYDFQTTISRNSMKMVSVQERFGTIQSLIERYSQ